MKVNVGEAQLLQEAKADSKNVVINSVLYTWTGEFTGRSPNAKRYEVDYSSLNKIDWENNKSIESKEFDEYWEIFRDFFAENSENIYLQTVQAVRDPEFSMPVSIYSELPQHSLFSRNMFVPIDSLAAKDGYEVFHFPSLLKEPTVLISISRKKILISGTLYAGEIKKSVFSVLNYQFPQAGFLPMHCSVNTDMNKENPAIFFGLSGTGKTTLSSDSNRILIGDDEHAWTSSGLTNFEGGCYAKTFNLSQEDEPEIWDACQLPNTILENVFLENGVPDFSSSRYTENGRASYSTSAISNADSKGYVHKHPKNIIMLTCDSFGVLPPVSKLTTEEAVEQFSLGYTAKVAGTESGVTEPSATFSPCFGAPFMPLPVEKYANLLREKIVEHGVQCWLVNTGWTGGPYGEGKRISIKTTRHIIDSILDGSLATQDTVYHSMTGKTIPLHPLIDKNTLIPENGWRNKKNYKKSVDKLMNLFDEQRKKHGL